MGKGSWQNGSVTLGEGMALKAKDDGSSWEVSLDKKDWLRENFINTVTLIIFKLNSQREVQDTWPG